MDFLKGRTKLPGSSKAAARGVFLGLLSLAMLMMAAPCRGNAEGPLPPAEYQLKAVLLYNFVQFVDWPPDAFPDEHAPFTVGVLGPNPFGGFLAQILRGEKVNQRPIEVKLFANVAGADGCQILFISRGQAGNLAAILPQLSGKPILLVSDTDQFIARGGMIQLRMTPQKTIAFSINPEAAKASRLTISSKLLRLAENLRPE
jgi:hypothetical protein